MKTDSIILCLNSGSSSVKFALYQLGKAESLLAVGAVERIGLPDGRLWVRGTDGKALMETHRDFPDHTMAVHLAFATLEQLHLPQPDAVGHRLVHGGSAHVAPERITSQLLASLQRLVAFAP